MVYAQIRTQEEKQRLGNALKASKNKKLQRRLRIIESSAKGFTVTQLSREFGLCEATIRHYIELYNEGGLANLVPLKQTGRQPKIAHWTKEQWEDVLMQSPEQYEKLGSDSNRWTLELISLYLKEYHRISVSLVSVYNSLQRTGVKTRRRKLYAVIHV